MCIDHTSCTNTCVIFGFCARGQRASFHWMASQTTGNPKAGNTGSSAQQPKMQSTHGNQPDFDDMVCSVPWTATSALLQVFALALEAYSWNTVNVTDTVLDIVLQVWWACCVINVMLTITCLGVAHLVPKHSRRATSQVSPNMPIAWALFRLMTTAMIILDTAVVVTTSMTSMVWVQQELHWHAIGSVVFRVVCVISAMLASGVYPPLKS